MILYPAVDIREGRCVRLRQGDFGTAHQVAESPLQAALSFAREGAQWLHIVDLDGARTGCAANRACVEEIIRQTGLKAQLGGGIRDVRAVEAALSMGVSRVVIGSAAVQNPDFVKEAVCAYGGAVAVGIDAADGKVSIGGWTEKSDVDAITLAKRMEDMGVETIIFTDIARDGMLLGPSLKALEVLVKAVRCQVIASGGVRNIDDIRALCEMGVQGAICGKSLYEGTLSLPEGIALCAKWKDCEAVL